ncbi:uncharacterized protein LOC125061403 isoform X2 [Pieris napi]|uniref:uncharacterized protein LOC125061403 isoform X2 n=1 Tax=Pieris napi TaxID=78633 RepID=UPI001FBBC255|nr:uncharacterized protein LOC125061403 isoform X2 [Pieris napi]
MTQAMFQYEYEKRASTTRETPVRSHEYYARRPLPPRPECDSLPAKTSVPLKVWIIAGASCFAVCAILVLATVVITRWGTTETYTTREIYEAPEPIYFPHPQSTESTDEIQYPILEKLSIFKNIVANRKPDLASKPQIHPLHDTTLHHAEKKIEKKDKPKAIPEFKPTLPDIFTNKHIKLSDGYIDLTYEDYYNDENLYDDYMQSNTMTSYLIEKVQELYEWINSDPTFVKKENSNFGEILKALNDSLIEGNVTIVMKKLRDVYFGDNYTVVNSGKPILKNSTSLLSFGILTLDVMLLHNIQLMAWENQEGSRNKMLKDPDVFAFNALFMEPSKVEAKRNEVLHYYENRMVLNQLSNREAVDTNIQNQMSRNIDANTHALNHLQTSFNDSSSVASSYYTDLDCVWLLYCKNLVATSKLNPPYGTMARINGLALRMLAGELVADRALDTMLYEALTGWTELRCADMFPKCSKSNAAGVVLDSILQPLRKAKNST